MANRAKMATDRNTASAMEPEEETMRSLPVKCNTFTYTRWGQLSTTDLISNNQHVTIVIEMIDRVSPESSVSSPTSFSKRSNVPLENT